MNALYEGTPNWHGDGPGQFQSFDGKGAQDGPYQPPYRQTAAGHSADGDLIIIEAGKGNRKGRKISVSGVDVRPGRQEKSPKSTSDLFAEQSEQERNVTLAPQGQVEQVPLSPVLGFPAARALTDNQATSARTNVNRVAEEPPNHDPYNQSKTQQEASSGETPSCPQNPDDETHAGQGQEQGFPSPFRIHGIHRVSDPSEVAPPNRTTRQAKQKKYLQKSQSICSQQPEPRQPLSQLESRNSRVEAQASISINDSSPLQHPAPQGRQPGTLHSHRKQDVSVRQSNQRENGHPQSRLSLGQMGQMGDSGSQYSIAQNTMDRLSNEIFVQEQDGSASGGQR